MALEGQDEQGLFSGILFNPRGKWKYSVKLDYGGYVTYCEDPENKGYRDPHMEAEFALTRATKRNVSGVTITRLNDYWILVVPQPPNGFPICVLPHELFLAGQNID